MSVGFVGATPAHATFPWGCPRDLPVFQWDAEVPQGRGQSQAGGCPQCCRQEAEVWGRREISILRALPSDLAQTGVSAPPS